MHAYLNKIAQISNLATQEELCFFLTVLLPQLNGTYFLVLVYMHWIIVSMCLCITVEHKLHKLKCISRASSHCSHWTLGNPEGQNMQHLQVMIHQSDLVDGFPSASQFFFFTGWFPLFSTLNNKQLSKLYGSNYIHPLSAVMVRPGNRRKTGVAE